MLVVCGGDRNKRALLELYYNSLTVRHPSQSKTIQSLSRDYWWLGMHVFTREYMKGCACCQESKLITHPNMPPIQPIHPYLPTRPFSTIAMDFIVRLPTLQGYNSVLTIMDHNCTKAIILLLCREEMDLLDFTRLYLKQVFPFIGIPERVISDQDPQFTSKIFQEVCSLLKV